MTTVVAAIIEQEDRVLVCQRSANSAHPLKWEFPGGKVDSGESEAEALRRELREELGIEAEIGPEITRYQYAYPGKNAILLVFHVVHSFEGQLENKVFETIAWSRRETLTSFDFLEGELEIIRMLTARATGQAKAES